jgi:hypothetical protein
MQIQNSGNNLFGRENYYTFSTPTLEMEICILKKINRSSSIEEQNKQEPKEVIVSLLFYSRLTGNIVASCRNDHLSIHGIIEKSLVFEITDLIKEFSEAFQNNSLEIIS